MDVMRKLHPHPTRWFAFCLTATLMVACQQQSQPPPQVAGPPDPPMRSGEPIGLQVQRVDDTLRGERFRVLLDFETPADTAFINGDPGVRIDTHAAHSGRGALAIGPTAKKFTVKLSSLVAGQPFPGAWALVGGYFYAQEPARVTVSYTPAIPTAAGDSRSLRRTVKLIPGKWTPVMADVSSLADPNADPGQEPGTLAFEIDGAARTVWCDDVMVVDNTHFLVDAPASGDGWTVRRRGFVTTLDRPSQFKVNLPTPDSGSDGWVVCEASTLRVVCISREGGHWWAICSDGRQYQDGRFGSLTPDDPSTPDAGRQHSSPADLSVPEEMGRVDRNNPADRNNDGYAELTGSYELIASNQPRFEFTLSPRTRALVRPIVDIARLPAGTVLVSMEGELVETVARLPDGRVLIQLPGAIERPVTVNVRVQ
jgi:hypothetical protein